MEKSILGFNLGRNGSQGERITLREAPEGGPRLRWPSCQPEDRCKQQVKAGLTGLWFHMDVSGPNISVLVRRTDLTVVFQALQRKGRCLGGPLITSSALAARCLSRGRGPKACPR